MSEAMVTQADWHASSTQAQRGDKHFASEEMFTQFESSAAP